jgi:hypothetical protein
MSRFVAFLVAGVATVAVVATASPAATTPTNFTVTTTIDAISAIGGCCTDNADGTTTGAFRRIGKASLAETFSRCDPSYCFPNGQDTNGENSMSMTFVTSSGDELMLVGDGLGQTLTQSGYGGSGTWTVWSPGSTGRFARATGSGTYTATFTYTAFGFPYSSGTLSITLSGNLSLGPTS